MTWTAILDHTQTPARSTVNLQAIVARPNP
jgi:hypothetical protein